MSEITVKCLLCGRKGFTTRGLRAHWCSAKPAPKGHHKHSAPLTRDEWLVAVNLARKLAGLKEVK